MKGWMKLPHMKLNCLLLPKFPLNSGFFRYTKVVLHLSLCREILLVKLYICIISRIEFSLLFYPSYVCLPDFRNASSFILRICPYHKIVKILNTHYFTFLTVKKYSKIQIMNKLLKVILQCQRFPQYFDFLNT